MPPMPWRLLVVCSALGVAGGATFGFVRGLAYPPTLPLAIIEGGLLIGVPSALFGLVLAAAWLCASALRRRI